MLLRRFGPALQKSYFFRLWVTPIEMPCLTTRSSSTYSVFFFFFFSLLMQYPSPPAPPTSVITTQILRLLPNVLASKLSARDLLVSVPPPNYASPSLGDPYCDRQLTPNFEFRAEIFCVPACFHTRIPKSCSSLHREINLVWSISVFSSN